MRIAVLAPGTSVHTHRWVSALAERGHDILLVTVHAPPAGVLPATVSVEVVGTRPPVSYYLATRRARRVIAAFAPQVVHAHYASGYGTLARRVGVSPLLLSVWGSDVFVFPEGSARRRRLVATNLRSADGVCATSEVMARRVNELTDGEVSPTVIAFGVDTEVFRPADRIGSSPIVGTVKTLAPGYRIDDLIRAFELVRQRIPGARLRVGGTGPQRSELERLVASLGLADSVDFLGSIPHERVPSTLVEFDVFCALSATESFGVAVVEASACAIPVVVSDAGGLPEVVIDGVTGFIVPVGDISAAADRIVAILSEPERGAALGAAGRRFVQERYEWSGCVDRLEQLMSTWCEPGKITGR